MPHPLPTDTEPHIPADLAAETAFHNHTLMREIVDKAHELALLIHQEAIAVAIENATEPGVPRKGRYTKAADFAAPFERVSRCMRRGIILLEHIAAPKPAAPARAAPAQKPSAKPKQTPGLFERPVNKLTDAELLERMVREKYPEPLDPLDGIDDDLHDIRPNRPIADLIADIFDDFGMDPPTHLERWSPATIDNIIHAAGGPSLRRLDITRNGPPPRPPAAEDENPPEPDYPLQL